MTKISCEVIQELLLEKGISGAKSDPGVESHLAECSDCAEFLLGLSAFETVSKELPTYDASDAVVTRTIESVRLASKESSVEISKFRNINWSSLLGGVIFAIILAVLSYQVLTSGVPILEFTRALKGIFGTLLIVTFGALAVVTTGRKQFRMAGSFATACLATLLLRNLSSSYYSGASLGEFEERFQKQSLSVAASVLAPALESDAVHTPEGELHYNDADLNAPVVDGIGASDGRLENEKALHALKRDSTSQRVLNDISGDEREDSPSSTVGQSLPAAPLKAEETATTLDALNEETDNFRDLEVKDLKSNLDLGETQPPAEQLFQDKSSFESKKRALSKEIFPSRVRRLEPQGEGLAGEDGVAVFSTPFALPKVSESLGGKAKVRGNSQISEKDASDSLSRFWASRAITSGIAFKSPHGYWQNTYIPGDPALRILAARLAGARGGINSEHASQVDRILSLATPSAQPIDSPTSSAIAITLNADTRGVDGKSRVLLQVGLKGATQNSADRQPMNIAIVLDADRAHDSNTQKLIESTLSGFDAGKVPGDRISLTVSGCNFDSNIAANDFRYGTLQIALKKLFNPEHPCEESISVLGAVKTGIEHARSNDDPNAPLGRSLVVLISSRDLSGMEKELGELAYQGAVQGIPVSTIGIGEAAIKPLSQIAALGQGNRRVITEANQAKDTVAKELVASSEVVARAVRLNIRLAPGVKLVDVVGSESLDAKRAEQVRRAEQSIDKRISKNFGIEADRGADEDGIQIVIPAFYSGDTHTVLLDVVVPGPGPVAEVSAKYKDLVFMKNGSGRDSLALMQKSIPNTEKEIFVLKSYLGHLLSESLEKAGNLVAVGNYPGALKTLADFAALLGNIRASNHDLLADRDISRDIELLVELQQLLPECSDSPQARNAISSILTLSGKFKESARPRGTF